jgi:glycerophosphoryl diester phosphodiesterase
MATHPENTIPGFLHAMGCGADGVELDVWVTPDDRLVVTHDPLPNPPDPAQPMLDDVLALPSPDAFWFDIEAKAAQDHAPDPPRYAQLVSKAIRRSSVHHRVIVRSFDHEILRAFHAIEPDIPLAALIDYASDDWIVIAHAADASTISPRHSTATAERVARAHDAGIRVSVWTVNHREDWHRLAGIGVDTIITNDPCAAVDYFKYFFKSG